MDRADRIVFKVEDRDGKKLLCAVDEAENLEMTVTLPDNFSELPDEKKKYWMERRIRELAKDMKRLILDKAQNRIVSK